MDTFCHTGEWTGGTVHHCGKQPMRGYFFCNGDGDLESCHVSTSHIWTLEDGTSTTSLKKGDTLIPTSDGNRWTVRHVSPIVVNEEAWTVTGNSPIVLEGGIPF